jgi:hypothetical protein
LTFTPEEVAAGQAIYTPKLLSILAYPVDSHGH